SARNDTCCPAVNCRGPSVAIAEKCTQQPPGTPGPSMTPQPSLAWNSRTTPTPVIPPACHTRFGYRHRVDLPDDLLALLRRPSSCYPRHLLPSGAPHLTQTWVDTDGRHILINTVQGRQKVRNIERDPRVAVTISDPDRPSQYYAIRGRVLDVTTDGAV